MFDQTLGELGTIGTLLQQPIVLGLLVLVLGLLLGVAVGRINKQILMTAGIGDAVEGTPFERTARSIGTSTVSLIARITSWFIYGVTILTAIHISGIFDAPTFWFGVAEFVPRLFIAVLVMIAGFILADKAELAVSERLKNVKLPEINILPLIVKYSVLYIALLIALGQVGVNTTALLVLLTVYVFGVVLIGGLAFKDFLSSGAAGMYLLLNQPYGIGDEVRIGDRQGIVQEMTLLTTRIENDDAEFIVPNRVIFEDGIARMRN
ncbi:mechanosensitive ion channel family protein [Natranaeroarchaeum sulfidigenes]|uniref:Small-conductance mechanosensitive channel n=1 Tax=Natranaeroarchaeum sulfidigenes TaxID=2784880 RepID=A0A897MRA9_9EURY|nr:mechanosensitive ion channel domain-containing protein [Natranaeroarchaeum sulfidigenes]QSG02962.1 Small-conductance mechanosensitive channel [Natranaeroarchaeum sulfidigenes]